MVFILTSGGGAWGQLHLQQHCSGVWGRPRQWRLHRHSDSLTREHFGGVKFIPLLPPVCKDQRGVSL